MADLSNSSAAAVVDGVASKKELQKPEKPNEEAFQAALKKAIKEHADAQAKFVCNSPVLRSAQGTPSLIVCAARLQYSCQ